jgi:hypothetical protein
MALLIAMYVSYPLFDHKSFIPGYISLGVMTGFPYGFLHRLFSLCPITASLGSIHIIVQIEITELGLF